MMTLTLLAFGETVLSGFSAILDDVQDWVTDAIVHGTVVWWMAISVVLFILIIRMRK
jgi:hypothetical protein